MGQSSQRWAPQVLMQPEDFPNDRTYEAPRSADGETDAPAEETWKRCRGLAITWCTLQLMTTTSSARVNTKPSTSNLAPGQQMWL